MRPRPAICGSSRAPSSTRSGQFVVPRFPEKGSIPTTAKFDRWAGGASVHSPCSTWTPSRPRSCAKCGGVTLLPGNPAAATGTVKAEVLIVATVDNLLKQKLGHLLGMRGGYVLDFSNASFADFVRNS